MSGKIAYYNKKHFLKRVDFDRTGSKCTIKDLVFEKGETLKHRNLKKAMNYCKQYNDRNLSTIVVRGEQDIVIWIEKKPQTTSTKSQNDKTEVKISPQTSQQPLPTKTVTKKYRGQVYEEVVIDWAAVQQIKQPKPRRKYRGQYVD